MDTVPATRVRYLVDPTISRFNVRVAAAGLLSALGHNPTIGIRGMTGELELVPDTLADASVKFRIRADKLSVQDDVSEKDRREIERMMFESVLQTARFPEIVFESTRISATPAGEGRYSMNIGGRLTLHGVTRDLSIPAQVAQTGDMLRAFGEFSLRQTDHGITLVSVAGGALKVKDELRFSFDIVARKQG
jgi:polyisoprenoid-binding protein YceI